MKTLEEIIYSLTDDELDLLIEKIDGRREAQERERREAEREWERRNEEKKYCKKCGKYLSCRERRKSRCDVCFYLRGSP